MNSSLHRFVNKVDISNSADGCWVWQGAVGSDGYGRLRRRGKTYSAHRYAYELFKSPIPEGLCVMHRCDVPLCVNPVHLVVGTKADNTKDMLLKKRYGNTVPKLNFEQVHSIRAMLRSGATKAEVSERFNICRSTVQDIETGSCWNENPLQGQLFA